MNEKPNLRDIYAIFTRNPVLLPLIPGTKIINDKGWTATTWENTQNPNYQARLRNTTNVGILLGKNSSNLIFFDWDTQPALDWFLENNPRFKESFRVTGKGVGGQVGGYAQGDYPANAIFKVPQDHPLAAGGIPDDKGVVQVGSLRGDRLQSVLCGIHPITKGRYSWPNDVEPITFNFESVVWHPDLVLPWTESATHSAGGNGSGPLSSWATECVSIDFLWKHFGFPTPRKNPSASPFRDDNTPGHESFSIHLDEKSGKQVFKDFHDNYTHHKGDSYKFYQLASGLDSKTAFTPFMEIANAILNGETPPSFSPPEIETDLYIPPVRKEKKVNPIAEAAYTGFLGEWVRYVEPQTECNRDNLLLQLVTTTGIVLGRKFYSFAGQDLYPNLFTVILGPTGARKGTALNPIKKFYELAAADWHGARDNWKSGEALVHFTRDPVWRAGKLKDQGVNDKRVLVEETELIHLFKASEWTGNTLTDMLRKAWDSPTRFSNTSKGSAEMATNPHIGTIGHMTNEEFLLVHPGNIDSGLMNRITWGNASRARFLPDVQPIEWPPLLLEWFRDIYAYAYSPCDLSVSELAEIPPPIHVPLDANAKLLWEKVYRAPSLYTGTLGKVLERVLSQARKIALIYAICDKSGVITRNHLEAGLGIAEHSKANAIEIFAGFGPNVNANKILSALRRNPQGLSRTQINKHVFNSKVSGDDIHEALLDLTQNKLITTPGRQARGEVVWRAV